MWQRFTENARKVVFFAQQEAGARGESYVSTEHLLLGLIREDGSTAIKMLSKFGVTREGVKAAVEREMDTSVPTSRKTQDMQLTPRAKRVIDVSYDEARGLNHDYIGTEHLLLGLFREGEGVAAKSLRGLGLELETLRAAARELVPENTGATTVRREEASPKKITPEHFLAALLHKKDSIAVRALVVLGLSPEEIQSELEQITPQSSTEEQDRQLTPAAKRLVELAFEQANKLTHLDIGPEHLLLGLIAEGQSPAAQLLATHGVDLERARGAVRQLRGAQEESGDSS